ncbi:hypothetical protein GCM10009416_15260 [Craurococcus roseus]|uniref:Uncharacterized protein n=1 Tax=Craurococcus roseus TaxID=77585 RepID=A0ABN1EZD7_9PROT
MKAGKTAEAYGAAVEFEAAQQLQPMALGQGRHLHRPRRLRPRPRPVPRGLVLGLPAGSAGHQREKPGRPGEQGTAEQGDGPLRCGKGR